MNRKAFQNAQASPPVEPNPDFDIVGFCIDWEAGRLTDEQTAEGFQHLLDSNVVWQLQGCYGRTARALLDAGLIKQR